MERKEANNATQRKGSEKKQVPDDFNPLMPGSVKRRTPQDADSSIKKFLSNDLIDSFSKDADDASGTNDSVYTNDTVNTTETDKTIETDEIMSSEPKVSTTPKVPTVPKRISSKHRKESLDEYRDTFLQVPKLDDRKPVFVSREVRDRLDEIVRKLGGRRLSVSGFVENLARHHLSAYHEDIEVWRKL